MVCNSGTVRALTAAGKVSNEKTDSDARRDLGSTDAMVTGVLRDGKGERICECAGTYYDIRHLPVCTFPIAECGSVVLCFCYDPRAIRVVNKRQVAAEGSLNHIRICYRYTACNSQTAALQTYNEQTF
jgi:hypothetical protein